jgi:hypothetical protein
MLFALPLITVLGPIVAVGISTLGAYVVVARKLSGNISRSSDAANVWEESASIREFYRAEVVELRSRLHSLEEENALLRARVTKLERVLDAHGVTP